jgi:hypothetical protein
MGKKVLRYTESEFVTLLESMVKKVQKEQLNESKKEMVKKEISKNRKK